MSNRIQCANLHIDEALHALVVNEIAPGTGIDPDHFWQGVADIWAALGPENQRLLAERDALVLRTERSPNIGHALPEMIGINAGARRDLVD